LPVLRPFALFASLLLGSDHSTSALKSDPASLSETPKASARRGLFFVAPASRRLFSFRPRSAGLQPRQAVIGIETVRPFVCVESYCFTAFAACRGNLGPCFARARQEWRHSCSTPPKPDKFAQLLLDGGIHYVVYLKKVPCETRSCERPSPNSQIRGGRVGG
jgi:hypothetical protein